MSSSSSGVAPSGARPMSRAVSGLAWKRPDGASTMCTVVSPVARNTCACGDAAGCAAAVMASSVQDGSMRAMMRPPGAARSHTSTPEDCSTCTSSDSQPTETRCVVELRSAAPPSGSHALADAAVPPPMTRRRPRLVPANSSRCVGSSANLQASGGRPMEARGVRRGVAANEAAPSAVASAASASRSGGGTVGPEEELPMVRRGRRHRPPRVAARGE
mmetsp:Transcript_13321/g.46598  ORF Transcript_13321/g.46598 Transcript_13321/m.46598 type:complete len:217 (-) Transcript_13321:192-842(-)